MLKPSVNQPVYILLIITICLNLLPLQTQATSYTAPAITKLETNTTQTNPGPADSAQVITNTALPPGINFAPGYNKIRVDNTDRAALNNIAKNGGYLLADYGSFSLWKVSNKPGLNSLKQKSSVETLGEFDTIRVRSGTIDTKQPPSPGNNGLLAATSQFWIIQFFGPVKSEWLDRLKKLGVDPVMYLPSNAYVIWAGSSQIDQINKQVASGDTELQWAGPYKTDYRLDPALKNRPDSKTGNPVKVTVQLYNTGQVKASLSRLQKIGGRVIQMPSQVLK